MRERKRSHLGLGEGESADRRSSSSIPDAAPAPSWHAQAHVQRTALLSPSQYAGLDHSDVALMEAGTSASGFVMNLSTDSESPRKKVTSA